MSGDSDNCEDDTAVAEAAAVEEDSHVEEEGQGHSLDDSNYNSGFIWEGMENYNGQCESFSGHAGTQKSAVNIQDIVSVLLFLSRDRVHGIVVETNHYAEQFMNC